MSQTGQMNHPREKATRKMECRMNKNQYMDRSKSCLGKRNEVRKVVEKNLTGAWPEEKQ